MPHSSPLLRPGAALVAAAALFSAPLASAAITAFVDPAANTITLVINNGSWIMPTDYGSWQLYDPEGASYTYYASSATYDRTSGTTDLTNAYFGVTFAPGSGNTVLTGISIEALDIEPPSSQWSGTITATFDDLDDALSLTGNSFEVTSGLSSDPIQVVIVPEPSSLLLSGLGLSALLLRRRRA